MKGVVFTELFSFIEENYSMEFLQETIELSKVESQGVYSATGTYPFCEMGALLGSLVEKTGKDATDLLKAFGVHLFGHFVKSSPHHFVDATNAFDFLDSVETHIHVDVKKLYPDAELPTFETHEHTADKFVMTYKSKRGLGALCEGLIIGCMEYFGEKATISKETLATTPVTKILFTLQK